MIEGLKPHPKHKPAEMRQLGTIPSHWFEKRAKFLYREVDERSATGNEELLSVSHKTGVTPRSQKNVTMFKAESYVGHKLCRPDDLAINTMWGWMGALGVSNHTGIISPAYGVYRPTAKDELLPRYANVLLRTPQYIAEFVCRSTGIRSSRLRMYPEQFLRIPLAYPPPDEQAAIVKFLDHADRRIRRYVRTKQRLIKLLEEQKQAIIHQAVTRGLEPNVRMKPSGVAWLGDVPEHWQVRKLGQLTRQIIDGTHFTPTYLDEGVAFLRVKDIHDAVVNESKLRRISHLEHLQLNKRCAPAKGDLLLSKNGTIGLTKVVDWDFPFSIFVSLCLIKPIATIVSPQFISFAFAGGLLEHQLSEVTKTTSVTNLHLDKIRSLVIPLPPADEQTIILEKTKREIEPVVLAGTKAKREIDLLREFRTRLISDVVTGKLDVRQAAASLPDESPDDTDVEIVDDDTIDDEDVESTDEESDE